MNRLAIVIPNWNGADSLIACVDSLLNQTYKDFQIVVVDNGSVDESKELLKKKQKKVGKEKLHIIYSPRNLGFAGGVNLGISYALAKSFDGVALFNNDATADKNWLKELASILKKQPKTGIVTGLLLHEDGKTIDSTGDWYSIWGLPYPRGRDETADKAPKAGLVFGASGGATLYRSAALREIGDFDQRFFAYYEDVDISFRAQLYGWKVYYNPKAIAYHEQGATSNKISGFGVYQTIKNLPLLYIKNVPTGLLFKIGVRFWLAYVLFVGNAALRHGAAVPAIKGWFVSVGLFFTHGLMERWKIQRRRTASTKYISSIIWPDLPPVQPGLRKLRSFFIRR